MKPLRTLVLFAAVGGLGLLGCGTPVTTDWARAPQLSADERGAPVHPDVAVVWAGPDGTS